METPPPESNPEDDPVSDDEPNDGLIPVLSVLDTITCDDSEGVIDCWFILLLPRTSFNLKLGRIPLNLLLKGDGPEEDDPEEDDPEEDGPEEDDPEEDD